jgi:hypothetical protein
MSGKAHSLEGDLRSKKKKKIETLGGVDNNWQF